MKTINPINKQSISGDSFFAPQPEKYLKIENGFQPFDESVVWYLNEIFWQNTKLWEKTYGEHYEKSLPGGLSSSHTTAMIAQSAQNFLRIVNGLLAEKKPLKKIFLLEQGPGSGKYVKGFLNMIQKENPQLYDKITFILSDTSEEILKICQKNLRSHSHHILLYQQKTPYDLPRQKIFFARHGNFWDQLPCKIWQKKDSKIYEVHAIAIIDTKLARELKEENINISLEEICGAISEKKLTSLIVKFPRLWKPLIQNLKLQTKLSNNKISSSHYENLPDETFIINSSGVLKNLQGYVDLVTWENGGYLEVVDMVTATADDFLKDRLPKKYDGALGVAVNGLEIKNFAQNNNLYFLQQPFRGINSVLRIFKHNLKNLLIQEHFFTMAEIAARRDQSTAELEEKTNKLFSLGTDIVVFSDQAGASEKFYPIEDLISNSLFNSLNGGAVMTNIAVRRKNREQLNTIFNNLRGKGVENVFILAGDPGPNDAADKLSWSDVIPLAKDGFMVGAVAHPAVNDFNNSREKIRLGAKFLIVQACYDEQIWQKWLNKVKQEKLFEKVPLIPVVIPIVSRNILAVIEALPDVPLSETAKKHFSEIEEKDLRAEGINMAREQIQKFKDEGIFSGVYLYSKSVEVVKEILTNGKNSQ